MEQIPDSFTRWPIFMRRGPRIEVDLENFALVLAGTLADNEQCCLLYTSPSPRDS